MRPGSTTSARAGRAEMRLRSAAVARTSAPCNTRLRERGTSDDKLITAPRHVDLARFLEHAYRTYDSGLRLFDRLQLDRSEQLNLLGEVGRRAFGHVLHDLVAHLL